jgi:hypothetical protein
MINLLTRAPKNCLPFQNQIANDEDQTFGNIALSDALFIPTKCTVSTIYLHLMRICYMFRQ